MIILFCHNGPPGLDSLESIPGLLKHLQIWALYLVVTTGKQAFFIEHFFHVIGKRRANIYFMLHTVYIVQTVKGMPENLS
jgi:hypothetical protein